MSACWSNSKFRGAPSTIFSNSQMSPRQLANKAFTLGCKKLERDTRRTKPLYDTRIRVLISNQIQRAEETLNKRTRRTNRRVMAAEDDDSELSFASSSSQERRHQNIFNTTDKSPLRVSGMDNEEDDRVEHDTPSLSPQTVCDQEKDHVHSLLSSSSPSSPSPPLFLSQSVATPSNSSPPPVVLVRDCRPVELSPSLQPNTTARIESIM